MLKGKSKYIILALTILISLFGVTYAFYEYYRVGNNHQLIVGNIYLTYNENTDAINLSNVFPLSKEKARSRTDNFITFTVSGLNTTTNKDIWYEIRLNEGDSENGKIRAKAEDLRFDLSEIDKNGDELLLVDAMSYAELNEKSILVNVVDRNTTTEDQKTYKLRMWLSEDVIISDTLEGADYTTSDFANSYASAKVSVYGDFVEKELSIIGYVNYNVDRLGISKITPTPIYYNTPVTITNEVTNATNSRFLGWSTSLNGEVEYQPGDLIKKSDLINNNVMLYPVLGKEYLIDKVTSTMTLTEEDVDGTRFVSGQVNNNYLWYSGKLWRIVSIDKDSNIKLVTQGNMTTLNWNTSSSTNYSASQIRTWLKNEFLPTLYDAENLLANEEWDYTTYTSFPTKKNTDNSTKLTGENAEKVGLLNIYDFMMTGGTSSSGTNTFLNNGYSWWTMSPTSGTNLWFVFYSSSPANNYSPTFRVGVRPAVNLKSGIALLGGTGTKSDPYTIEGDKLGGTTSELLSDRISGEYIKFNNTKYRIVGFETINGQKLTKVTMADYSVNKNTLTTSIAFGSSSSDLTYNTSTGIGKYMYNWYNGTSINTTYKNMIATDGIKWYTGPVTTDYTKSKTGTTVVTPIGLGYYGEMFSSQFGDGYNSSVNIWLITRYSTSSIVGINDNSYSNPFTPTNTRGARPSFYLKANVKIGDSGTGMPHSPFEIIQ